jgi:hypothetical protein
MVGLVASACITVSAPTEMPGPATATPAATAESTAPPTGGSATSSPATATAPPDLAAPGPPFPAPIAGQAVYDFAELLSPVSEARAADLIATIEENSGAEIVVFTQFKPGSDEASTEEDARALIEAWAIGGDSQDGMVVFWNSTRLECKVGVSGNGQIQLYAAPGFMARVSSEERQQIFDQDMLPWLRYCDEDNALVAGLEALDELVGIAPTPVPTPTSTQGACGDDAYSLNGMVWPDGYEFYFDEASVPEKYDKDEILEVIKRALDNITGAKNDCGLPDNVSATWHYRGMTTDNACPDLAFSNVVGFGRFPRGSNILAQMCPYGDPVEGPLFAHISINPRVAWSLSVDDCSGRQENLEATLTHEVGHVFGLGHVSERRHGDLTMSTRSNGPCTTEEISLGLGDVRGLEELYGSP